MPQFQLQLENPWFLILCLLCGLAYAGLLYKKQYHWSKQANWLLASLRFLTTTTLCFLLLNPLIKNLEERIEKPSVVIAIDNSRSVSKYSDSTELYTTLYQLEDLKQEMLQNFDVEVKKLEGTSTNNQIQSIRFDQETTDLSSILKDIKEEYEGRKLASVILLSDGIINKGYDPNFETYSFPIHTIGIGDTVPKPDINIKEIKHNKIAYEGNQFVLSALLTQYGFDNKKIKVSLQENGKEIQKKTLKLKDNEHLEKVDFLVSAKGNGKKQYKIAIEGLPEEYNTENNTKTCYIDIVKGKQRILLVAAGPHPDIQTIRAAIEDKEVYDLEIKFVKGEKIKNNTKFDLVIFHQLPSKNVDLDKSIQALLENNTPKLFFGGALADFEDLSKWNNVLKIKSALNKTDKVFLAFNNNFKAFNYAIDFQRTLQNLSPLTVPFANIELKTGAEVIAYQKVGSVLTKKPLIAINQNNNPRSAVVLGEGIWDLQMNEYFQNQKSEASKSIIQKIIKLLASKKDNRQFKVFPDQTEYVLNETVNFETEIYNQIFEPIYGNTVTLQLKSDTLATKTFEYIYTPQKKAFNISGLKEGIYQYTAETKLNNEVFKTDGTFIIKKLSLESNNSLANHLLLKKLSTDNNGQFHLANKLQSKDLIPENKQGIIFYDESYVHLFHQEWIFLLIILLLSTEWFFRKYLGAY